MTAIFADTSFYIALVSARDTYHGDAITLSATYRGDIVTTEYVLLELGNYLGSLSRRGFLNLVNVLRQEPQTDIVPSSPALFAQGLELYAERPDKEWSLTDCISFAVMRGRGITEALTFDHHFEQAGFRRLLSG